MILHVTCPVPWWAVGGFAALAGVVGAALFVTALWLVLACCPRLPEQVAAFCRGSDILPRR